jgi:hypothetical protein
MARRSFCAFFFLGLIGPGCSGPIVETGPDDPLPLPPMVLVVNAAIPALAPAVAPQKLPLEVPGPEPVRPPDLDSASRTEVPEAGPPAETPRPDSHLPKTRSAESVPEPAPVDVADDHYHRDFSVPGDHVLFQKAAGSEQIWLAPDRGTIDRFITAWRLGDRKTYQAIVEKGDVRFVAPNTAAIVLAVEPKVRRVRITQGSLASLEGWIDEDHLRAAPPPEMTAEAKSVRDRELSRRKVTKAAKDLAETKAMMEFFGIKPTPSRPR